MTGQGQPDPVPSQRFRFEVALSFAGDEKRPTVRRVAEILRERLGEGKVFFDEWFEAELAGPDANTVLQNIYRTSSRLVVMCACNRYSEKPWPQDEWRAIQSLERTLRDAGSTNVRRMRFLPLRFGDGSVDGLTDTAIVPDVRGRSPEAIAHLILERLALSQRPVEISDSESASVRGSTHGAEAGSRAISIPSTTISTRSARRFTWNRVGWTTLGSAIVLLGALLGIAKWRPEPRRQLLSAHPWLLSRFVETDHGDAKQMNFTSLPDGNVRISVPGATDSAVEPIGGFVLSYLADGTVDSSHESLLSAFSSASWRLVANDAVLEMRRKEDSDYTRFRILDLTRTSLHFVGSPDSSRPDDVVDFLFTKY